MRRMLIVTAAVLIAALVVCGASLRAVNTAVDTALQLHHETLLAAQRRQSDLAVERMTQLAEFWEAKNPLLETLISHDALHEVSSTISEARICLECDDHDDFLRMMSVMLGALEHIQDEEAVSWLNLY